jgi:F-type H+-transporting ATPase subunit a
MVLGGMKEQGAVSFWKNLVPHGIPLWLWPLMLVIEIVGLIAKPFALTIRLFANMTAGHIVLAVLLGFTVVAKTLLMGALIVPASVLGAVAISCLEVFVAFLQAYIFTFLSAVFIGMCLHPEH